ncbi:MAG TPA: hypothetical protein VH394_05450, partial [Thermoanaerobaculia bacterium]|nr:hypothetical protein [Thermoanaerobaculia bacterium]
MKRKTLICLALLLVAATLEAAPGNQIVLVARDIEGKPVSGLRFVYELVKSGPTNKSGATALDLPADHRLGQQIRISLVDSKQAEDWFLVDPMVNVPDGSDAATVVLMRRSVFRQVGIEARDARGQKAPSQEEWTEEDRKRLLVEVAARHGLSAKQLETAIPSFAETQGRKDKGIAAFLQGEYPKAEGLLREAVDKNEANLIEALEYLASAQFEQ